MHALLRGLLRCASLAVVVAAAACSTPDATPPTTTPPAERPLEAKEVGRGEACNADGSCAAPAECRHVSGRQPNSGRQECWISCGEDLKSCPSGYECQMIYDGAGHVCAKKE